MFHLALLQPNHFLHISSNCNFLDLQLTSGTNDNESIKIILRKQFLYQEKQNTLVYMVSFVFILYSK